MEKRNLIVYLNTYTWQILKQTWRKHKKQTWKKKNGFSQTTLQQFIFVKKLLQCDICDYCCFQVDIKTHEKETWRRETSQLFLKTHTISSQNLFQCDICDYCCFQVDNKTHEKLMWRRETSQFFLKHIFAVHFVKTLFQRHICDYCCFQVVIKTHEKQTWRRETPQFILIHTLAVHRICSNVIFVTIAVFKLLLKHMKNKHGEEKPHSLS